MACTAESQRAQRIKYFHLPLRGRQMQPTTTRTAGGLNFSASSGEKQKHIGALNGALATGGKAPGLYGKKSLSHFVAR
jgi:hypothetical protein